MGSIDAVGRAVVVTGAAGGLGAATVRRLAASGWQVFAADLDGPALHALAGDGVVPVAADVTDGASLEALADRVRQEGGALQGLVNFAGVVEVGSLVEIEEAAFRRVIEVNLIGTFLATRTLFPLVHAGGGRIVVMSSETGWQTAMPFNGPYATSKHAVEAYADSLRRELMLLGVPVIKVRPGAFDTGMVSGVLARFEREAARSRYFGPFLRTAIRRIPREQARAGDPADLAALVERALTARRWKPAYAINTNPQPAVLTALPTRLVDRLVRVGLKRAAASVGRES